MEKAKESKPAYSVKLKDYNGSLILHIIILLVGTILLRTDTFSTVVSYFNAMILFASVLWVFVTFNKKNREYIKTETQTTVKRISKKEYDKHVKSK